MSVKEFILLLLIRIAGSAVFEGCFLDDSQDRDLDSYHLTLNDNSPWKCIEQCKQLGTLYAGVQNGRDCYCGLDYGKHGKLHDTRCKSPCSGDRELWCGGELANHIFRTGLITLGKSFLKLSKLIYSDTLETLHFLNCLFLVKYPTCYTASYNGCKNDT